MKATSARQLYDAVSSENLGRLKTVLDRGADPNEESDSGFLPLFVAAAKGSQAMIELLLEAGADPTRPCSRLRPSPLEIAVERGHARVAETLRRAIEGRTLLSAFVEAVLAKDSQIVLSLINQGANVNGVCPTRKITVLCLACSTGDGPTIKALVAAGADLNGRTGRTSYLPPLHMAVRKGDVNVCKLLIDLGADITAPDQNGKTPLYAAAQTGNRSLAELFLESCELLGRAKTGTWNRLLRRPSLTERQKAVLDVIATKHVMVDTFPCHFGDKHSWKHCKCQACGKAQDRDHDWQACTCSTCGARRDEMHDWDDQLKCRACGQHAPKWIQRLAEIIENLPIVAPMPQASSAAHKRGDGSCCGFAVAIQRPLKTALNLAAYHIRDHYKTLKANPESFDVGRKLSDSKYSSYQCSVLDAPGHIAGPALSLAWHSHFSEDEMMIRRHGDKVYSIYCFRYEERDDDGGKGWYV